MADDLVARPGDTGLDCHLTGLRLTAVDEVLDRAYVAEAVLTLSTMDAGGWYRRPGFVRQYWPDGKDIQIAFGIRNDVDVEPAETLATLHRWCRNRAYIEMTCAPGKQTLLRSRGECVVLPRSETAVSAGRETGS